MRNLILALSCLLATLTPAYAQDQFSDCAGAIILCEKSDLIVKKIAGKGKDMAEVGFNSCSDRLEELHSVWIKWQVGQPGSIEFTLEPLEEGDDLDFIVYELDGDIYGCSRKTELRCMASGEQIGATAEVSLPCLGRTGLLDGVSDTREKQGCGDDHDNFLAAIRAQTGDQFILYVNNYTSNNGFKLHWGGDATFARPEELPAGALLTVQESKEIYFKRVPAIQYTMHTDWSGVLLGNANLTKVGQARVENAFIGCGPLPEDVEKISSRDAFDIGLFFPNPTAGQARIRIDASTAAVARLELVDLFGRSCVKREFIIDNGSQVLTVPTEKLPSGLYVARIRVGNSDVTRKLVIAAR